ncbi:MAG: tetratricopeptide repeat protein [Myxococcota bacterium]
MSLRLAVDQPNLDPHAVTRQKHRALDDGVDIELALEKDPNYALAYVGIAQVWGSRQVFGIAPPHEAGPRVKAAAEKAIEFDSTLAEAHHRLASIRTWVEWDWEGGETAFRRAIQLKPNYPTARAIYSHYLIMMGRPDEAMAQIERALELDPFNESFQGFYALDLLIARRYDEAIAQLQNALKTAPNNPMLHTGLRDAFLAKGMYDEALAEWKALFFTPGERGLPEAMDSGYAEGGFREAVRRTAETWAARSDTIYVPATGVAALFAAAGEHPRALDWLERGFQVRHPNITGIGIGVGPISDSLRDDPRFQNLLRRMNLPGRNDE